MLHLGLPPVPVTTGDHRQVRVHPAWPAPNLLTQAPTRRGRDLCYGLFGKVQLCVVCAEIVLKSVAVTLPELSKSFQ
jgi:hypothetical protein